MDCSDGLVLTPDHNLITVRKSGHQQKPKLQGDLTIATSGVQPTNQDGVVEVSCHGMTSIVHLSMYCPRYLPTGKGWDLTSMKSKCLSPRANTVIKCPHYAHINVKPHLPHPGDVWGLGGD